MAEELTIGEKMLEGLDVFVIGMVTVFAVLMVLWFLIAMMGKIIGAVQKKPVAAPAVHAAAEPEPEEVENPDSLDSGELAAVIAAAVAAYQGGDKRLVVRSIRRAR